MGKKFCLYLIILLILLTACGTQHEGFQYEQAISVISREDGSGTRGAFAELFDLYLIDENGLPYDATTLEANITNNTAVMMTSVSSYKYAVGYLSLGSLNASVKPVIIDGAAPTAENIRDGSYRIARPFNIATTQQVTDVTQDFIDYILSSDGQNIVEAAGYIAADNSSTNFDSRKPEGTIVIVGSSSVAPVMEKLKESYILINTNAKIQIQQNDSTSGIAAATEGICDIGMASRALKDSEIEKGLLPTTIALDGVVVIVNNENPLDELTKEQVRDIFIGHTTHWNEID